MKSETRAPVRFGCCTNCAMLPAEKRVVRSGVVRKSASMTVGGSSVWFVCTNQRARSEAGKSLSSDLCSLLLLLLSLSLSFSDTHTHPLTLSASLSLSLSPSQASTFKSHAGGGIAPRRDQDRFGDERGARCETQRGKHEVLDSVRRRTKENEDEKDQRRRRRRRSRRSRGSRSRRSRRSRSRSSKEQEEEIALTTNGALKLLL